MNCAMDSAKFSRYKVGDRVVRKKATTYGAICTGLVEEAYGETLTIKWDGRYSNLKKAIKVANVAPISELEIIKSRVHSSNKKKLSSKIDNSLSFFEKNKSEDGWLYDKWVKLPLLPTDLEKYFNYEEKRHPEKGYLWAIKISKI